MSIMGWGELGPLKDKQIEIVKASLRRWMRLAQAKLVAFSKHAPVVIAQVSKAWAQSVKTHVIAAPLSWAGVALLSLSVIAGAAHLTGAQFAQIGWQPVKTQHLERLTTLKLADGTQASGFWIWADNLGAHVQQQTGREWLVIAAGDGSLNADAVLGAQGASVALERVIAFEQAGFSLYRPVNPVEGAFTQNLINASTASAPLIGDALMVMMQDSRGQVRSELTQIAHQAQTPFWRAFKGQSGLDLASGAHFSGALALDQKGQLAGLVRENGVLMPIGAIQQVSAHLLEGTHTSLGWLGVDYRELTGQERTTLGIDTGGLLITDVAQAGPAAGTLQVGHIITHVNGAAITDASAFNHLELFGADHMRLQLAGASQSEVEVFKAELFFEMTQGEPALKALQSEAYQVAGAYGVKGIQLKEVYDAQTGRHFAQIVQVETSGAQNASGLRAGQIIERVDGARVTTPQDFMYYASRARERGQAYVPVTVRGHDDRLKWVKFAL